MRLIAMFSISLGIVAVILFPVVDGQAQGEKVPGQAPDDAAFVTVWETGSDVEISLPLVKTGNYDFTVDWGDGTQSEITRWDQDEVTHRYLQPGKYTISIRGEIEGWRMARLPVRDADRLLRIERWGPLKFGDGGGYFRGAKNLRISATDTPDLQGVTSLRNTFQYCRRLDKIPGLHRWDVSSVEDMSGMFRWARMFSGDIGDWDVSSVEDMSQMFAGAERFRNDIGDWDVSSVEDMSQMFAGAERFRNDIGNWDVSSVEDMSQMFDGAEWFRNDIGDWDVSSVEDMSRMFRAAKRFNADIAGWDVSSVRDMTSMFENATAFDRDISAWEVSSVEDVSSMFEGAERFDRDLSSWDLASVEKTDSMFARAERFNRHRKLEQWGWEVSPIHLGQFPTSSPDRVPTTGEDCQQSRFCVLLGRCSMPEDSDDDPREVGESICETRSDSDCERSKRCEYRGECTACHGKCIKEWPCREEIRHRAEEFAAQLAAEYTVRYDHCPDVDLSPSRLKRAIPYEPATPRSATLYEKRLNQLMSVLGISSPVRKTTSDRREEVSIRLVLDEDFDERGFPGACLSSVRHVAGTHVRGTIERRYLVAASLHVNVVSIHPPAATGPGTR